MNLNMRNKNNWKAGTQENTNSTSSDNILQHLLLHTNWFLQLTSTVSTGFTSRFCTSFSLVLQNSLSKLRHFFGSIWEIVWKWYMLKPLSHYSVPHQKYKKFNPGTILSLLKTFENPWLSSPYRQFQFFLVLCILPMKGKSAKPGS